VEIARIVCMQCERVIRDFGVDSGLLSHGLCTDCAAEFAREIERLEPRDPPPLGPTPYPALARAR